MAGTFERLRSHNEAGRYLCVGLDPDPEHVAKAGMYATVDAVKGAALEGYCRDLFDATNQHAAAFKAQFACWAQYPDYLKLLFARMHEQRPDVPLILDGKFGDIGNTMKYWAEFTNYVGADAVTANPYMGIEDVGSELANAGIDVFYLASTSNKGSADIQQVLLRGAGSLDELVAKQVEDSICAIRPYGLVVGATRPHDLNRILSNTQRVPLLLPGVGTQGGDVEAVIGLLRQHKVPWTINVSRGIAEAVKEPESREQWLDGAEAAAQGYADQFMMLIDT